MNKSIFALIFPLLIILIIAGACAKVSRPSGGTRDKLPPVVVKSVPVNGSKNIKSKKISITFDENIILDNINDKLMVSPPMKKKPKIAVIGNNINIEILDNLKDSTTYTFYFQDAIRDLNEGNILDNYKFVFASGSVIDSLSVTGNVYNAFNLEVPEKTLALLYRELADSAVVKHFPDYISRVDKYGYFRIDNVRPGNYKLYALKDDDNSKNYNRTEEAFAFMDSLIIVTPENNFIPLVKDTVVLKKEEPKPVAKAEPKGSKKDEKKLPEHVYLKGDHQMILFTALKKAHYLTNSKRDIRYQLMYTLSVPPDSMKFDFSIQDVGKDKYFIEESRYRDTIKVWLTDSTLYNQQQISTIIKFPFTDTLGVDSYKQDTIPMRFLVTKVPKSVKIKKPKYIVENNVSGGFIKPGQPIILRSHTPFRPPDTTRIRLYELIDKTRKTVPFQLVRDTTISTKYVLDAKWSVGKKYLFIADSASFGDIYYENSDSTGIRFSLREPEYYSHLTLNIQNCAGPCIIQLLDINEKLIAIAKTNKDGKVEFPLVESGKYRARVIYDLDNDGKWTTGDFTILRQPEPVSYYPNELDLKPGWILDNQPWDIKIKNFKDQKLREQLKTTAR